MNPPAKEVFEFNIWVGKIPLEKGIATHSSILAWRIPWTEKPGGLQSTESDMTEATEYTHTRGPFSLDEYKGLKNFFKALQCTTLY